MGLTPASSRGIPGMSVASVSLTNAQVLALRASGITLVPAPGAGSVILGPANGFGFVVLTLDTAAAAYTNVAATATWQFILGGSAVSTELLDAQSLLTANDIEAQIGNFRDSSVDDSVDSVANLVNQPLRMWLVNPILGNITGGNAANTMTVTVGYQVLDLP